MTHPTCLFKFWTLMLFPGTIIPPRRLLPIPVTVLEIHRVGPFLFRWIYSACYLQLCSTSNGAHENQLAFLAPIIPNSPWVGSLCFLVLLVQSGGIFNGQLAGRGWQLDGQCKTQLRLTQGKYTPVLIFQSPQTRTTSSPSWSNPSTKPPKLSSFIKTAYFLRAVRSNCALRVLWEKSLLPPSSAGPEGGQARQNQFKPSSPHPLPQLIVHCCQNRTLILFALRKARCGQLWELYTLLHVDVANTVLNRIRERRSPEARRFGNRALPFPLPACWSAVMRHCRMPHNRRPRPAKTRRGLMVAVWWRRSKPPDDLDF